MTSRNSKRGASKVQTSAVLAAAVAGLGLLGTSRGAIQTWQASPVDANWANAANWVGGVAPVTGDSLVFGASTITALNNNLAANELFSEISFSAGAPAYTLAGNTINLTGNLTNSGTAVQTINATLNISGAPTLIDPGTGSGLVFAGALTGAPSTGIGLGVIYTNSGMVTISGLANYQGGSYIGQGTLTLTGNMVSTQLFGTGLGARTFTIGSGGTNTATMIINGGNWTANGFDPSIAIGGFATGTGTDPAVGQLVINSGYLNTNGGTIYVSTADFGSGAMIIHGGKVVVGNWLAVARGGGQGVMIQTGGNLYNTGANFTVGSYLGDYTDPLKAIYTISGGTANVVNNLYVGENSSGVVTIMPGGFVNVGNQIRIGVSANPSSGVFNINGGTALAGLVQSGGGQISPTRTSVFNFNGGLLAARGNNGSFIGFRTGPLYGAFIWGGGATIDDNGFNLTIPQTLQAPPDSGVSAAGLTASGSGYLFTPIVQITGGGGWGATALATIDTAGNLTGITITNPGTGYFFPPSIAVVGGGGTGSISGTPSLISNANNGGLTKLGPGTVTLQDLQNGTATGYTGTTTATGGLQLQFSSGGTAPLTNMINSASPLVAKNGLALTLLGANGSANSQTFASTTFTGGGASTVQLQAGTVASLSSLALSLGAITRGAGTTVDFNMQNATTNALGTINTVTANANFAGGQASILGGYATVGNTTWAVGGGNIAGLATYNAGFAAGKDVDAPAGASAPGAMTVNSVRFNTLGAATVDATGGLNIATGGILETSAVSATTQNASSNTVVISNGTITSGNGQDLIVIQNNAAASLTINSNITGAIALTKSGAGMLVLGNVANGYTGKTYVNGGKLNIAADASLGAAPGSVVADQLTLNGGGMVQLGGNFNLSSNRGITLNTNGGGIDTNGFVSTYSGVITGREAAFTKAGAGTLTVTNTMTNTGATNVTGGTLVLPADQTFYGLSTNGGNLVLGGNDTFVRSTASFGTGTVTVTGKLASSIINNDVNAMPSVTGGTPGIIVGNGASAVGVMKINGGTVLEDVSNATTMAGNNFVVGNTTGAVGDLQISSGTLIITSQLILGNGGGVSGGMTQTGGTVITGASATANQFAGYFVVGFNNDNSVFNMSGGNFTVGANFITIAAGAPGSLGQGVVNLSGNANFVSAGGMLVGEQGNGILNISGNATATTGNVNFTPNATESGMVNLLGGTLTTNQVLKGGSTAGTTIAMINFNGGTLMAGSASSTTFLTGLDSAIVWGGGAVLNDGGRTITIGQALVAPGATNGVTAIAVTGGAGYVETPVVSISGGGGSGAAAVANIDASGNLTGITVTNPGTGYTAAPTVTLLGGAGSGATVGNVTLAVSAGGGLTKNGSGTIVLSSTGNTYSGTTTINGGVLSITGALLGSGAVQVNSGGALGGGARAGAPAGSGIVTGPVTVAGGGAINMQDGASGTLALNGGLTVADASAASLGFDYGGSNGTNPHTSDLVVLGANPFTVNAGGAQVNLASLGAAAPGDVYTLMTYGSITGAGAGNVALAAGSVHSGLNTNLLAVNAGNITLTVTGAPIPAAAYWTGELGGNWNAAFFITQTTGNSNFHTGATNGINTNQFPGPITDVSFATTASPVASNLATTLGQNFDIKSLHLLAGAGAVSISGASAGATNALTIEGGGITQDAGSGGLTISAGVVLDAAQTWTDAGAAAPLTVTGVVSGNAPLTLGGAGTIVLGGVNVYTGGTTISSGTTVVGNNAAFGTGPVAFATGSNATMRLNGVNATVNGLTGDATSTVSNGNSSNGATLIMNAAGSSTFGGTLTDGATSAPLSLRVQGGGAVTLNGALSLTGAIVVRNGTLTLANTTVTQAGGTIYAVGDTAGQNGVLVLNNTTLNAGSGANPNIVVGTSVSGATGVIYVNAGSSITTAQELWLGADAVAGPAYGALIVNGGSVTTGSWLAMGRGEAANSAGSAIMDINSGSVTVNGNPLTIGSYQGTVGPLHAVTTVRGGTLNVSTTIFVGEYLSGELNIMGTGNVTGTSGVQLAVRGGGEFGVLNLNGGTLTTANVSQGGGALGVFNFNGGTLTSLSANTTFMTGLSAAYVWPGGATIDDANGVTIGQSLLAPTGKGVSAIAVTGGAGYVAEPMVAITGGGGTGATAIASLESVGHLTSVNIVNAGSGFTSAPTVNINGGGGSGAVATATIGTAGQITSIILVSSGTGYTSTPTISFTGGGGTASATASAVVIGNVDLTITNPGVGYTGTPTITLSGGGGSGATVGNVTLSANASGGLTKTSSGTTVLSGNNTYTGPTVVTGGGTLAVSANTNLGAVGTGASLTLDNGTLEATASFAMDNAGAAKRNITIGAGGGTFNVDLGQALTVSGNVTGGGGLTMTGGGKLNLSGTGSYTGTTTVTSGLLYVSGALTGTGAISVAGGLGGTGTVAGAVSVTTGGAIDLRDSRVGTLTLGSSLSLDGATMRFDLGGVNPNIADAIAMGSNTLTVGAGAAVVSLNSLGVAPGTYTLASFSSGITPSNITLDPLTTHFGGSTATLNLNPGSISVTITGAPIPSVAYWSNTVGDANWNSATGATFTTVNWNTNATGNVNTNQAPGATTDVFFATTNPASPNVSTMLGRDFVVHSIHVTNQIVGSVSIDGANNTLSIEGGGITVDAGTFNGLTITSNVNVVLGASQTWTNNSTTSPMTVNSSISGTANLTLAGAGTIQLGGANSYLGTNTINGGIVQLGTTTALGDPTNPVTFGAGSNAFLQLTGNSVTVGGLNGDSTAHVENSGFANATLTVNTTGNNSYGGTLANGTSGSAALALVVGGTGTLNLSGNSTYTGNTSINSGTVNLTGNMTVGQGAFFNTSNTGQNSVVTINGGNLTNTETAIGGIRIGNSAGGSGVMVVNSGSVSSTDPTSGELWVATTDGGYGGLVVNGGTVTTTSWLAVARGGGAAVFNVNGGTVNIGTATGNNLSLGSTPGVANTLHVSATFAGGTTNINNNMWVGESNNTIATLTGNGVVNVATTNTGAGVTLSVNGGITGQLNLDGGTLNTPFIAIGTNAGTHTGILNFNGGLLAASGTSNSFITTTVANVFSGGAKIDDGGNVITIRQNLVAPSGQGVTLGTLAATGSGYAAPPLVTISGGGGTGASAIANVDSSGNLTGITITNPGTGYTSAPSLTLFGGGGATTTSGALAVAANVSGGFIKQGAGTVVLTGANTYAGGTTINNGTLLIGATGALPAGRPVLNNSTLVIGASSVSGQISGNGTLSIGVGSAAAVLQVAAGSGVSHIGSINMTTTSRLDLIRNDMIVVNGSNVSGLIKQAANLGAWNGPGGITSSAAFASGTSSTSTALAYATGAEFTTATGSTAFDGLSFNPTDTLVKYTLAGDSNMDGAVTFADFLALQNNYNKAGDWAQGDWNYDGQVTFADFLILQNNYNKVLTASSILPSGGVSPAISTGAVPEPSSLLVLGLASMTLLARRRRR